MLHKNVGNDIKRVRNSFTDGFIYIVTKVAKTDKFNTPIPNQFTEDVIGRYPFRITAINTNDRFQFHALDVDLDIQVRIPYIQGIHAGMTAKIAGMYYNIEKAYPDFPNQELEILMSEEKEWVSGRWHLNKRLWLCWNH